MEVRSVTKVINEHSLCCQINHYCVVDCTWQCTKVRQRLSIPVLLLFLMLVCSAVTTSVWGLPIRSVMWEQSIRLPSSLR